MTNFEIIEKLAVITDTRTAETALYRVEFPEGNTALLLTKRRDTEDGAKHSNIVLSEEAANSLYMALSNIYGG